MSSDRFRFPLGDFECLAILDYDGSGNAETWFSNVPHELLRAEGIDPANIPSPGICLAVHTGSGWVLIDAGLGFIWKNGSNLARILAEEGIQPAHIILTHFDADHYGGLINSDHSLAFPGIPVYVCQDAWTDYTSEPFYQRDSRRPPEVREHLLLLAGQVKPLPCDGEILPGFTIVPLPGHKTHHIGIEVESRGQKLVFAADTFVHELHVKHFDWHFGGDEDHQVARQSRLKLARMASESGSLVLNFHFKFPGLGYLAPDGTGWQWQPAAFDHLINDNQ